MFWNLLANEQSKNVHRWMLWIEIALSAGLVFVLQSAVYAISRYTVDAGGQLTSGVSGSLAAYTWPGALATGLGFVTGNALGGLLIVPFAAAATAQEYSWRTFHLWLGRGVPRPVLLSAKFTGLLLPSLLVVLAAMLGGGLSGAFVSLAFDASPESGALDLARLAIAVLETTCTLLPYASLSFLIAVASRSVVASVAGGLAYALLVEGLLLQFANLLGGGVAKAAQVLPGALAASLTGANQAAGLPAFQSAAGLLLWALLYFSLALWFFCKQDLTN